MADSIPLASISDDELHSTVQRLTARSNVVLADLLARLGEVEHRGIHRAHACASLYTYCIYELRMSEDAAFRRAKAARIVREHPEVRDMIAKGELHLTGLLMIGPYLGGEQHQEILERASSRSKSEIARLIARIDPKPAVPTLVEPIGPAPRGAPTHRELVESFSGPVRTPAPGQRPEEWIELDDPDVEGAEVATNEPAAPLRDNATELERALRYKVQFTAGQEYVDLVSQALDLLSHEIPRPHLPDANDSANTAPATPSREYVAGTAPARHIPASVRRVVWARDGERCAFVDGRGHRCRETRVLELHHRHAHARGGPPTVDNLEVRCRAPLVAAGNAPGETPAPVVLGAGTNDGVCAQKGLCRPMVQHRLVEEWHAQKGF